METLIYGAGHLGQKAFSILSGQPGIDVIGFIEDDPLMIDFDVCGLKVIGQGRALRRFHRFGVRKVCIALFEGEARIELSVLCDRIGYEVIGAISPGAQIDSRAVIGRGNIISEDVIVEDGARIGDNCYLAPGVVLRNGDSIADGENMQGGGSGGGHRDPGRLFEPALQKG